MPTYSNLVMKSKFFKMPEHSYMSRNKVKVKVNFLAVE